MRTLINGTEVPEDERLIELTIRTHCPEKWRFVDLETGDVWQWNGEWEHGKKTRTPQRGEFMRATDLRIKKVNV
jgi:hypothetical protein